MWQTFGELLLVNFVVLPAAGKKRHRVSFGGVTGASPAPVASRRRVSGAFGRPQGAATPVRTNPKRNDALPAAFKPGRDSW